MSKLFTVSLFLFMGVVPLAQAEEPANSCWQNLRAVSRGMPDSLDCVRDSAKDSFAALCAEDGIAHTKDFRAYLVLLKEYAAQLEDAKKWLAANPGASEYPPELGTKIKNAQNAWMVGGKRFHIEDEIEKLRRKSVNCK